MEGYEALARAIVRRHGPSRERRFRADKGSPRALSAAM
jgi:hypothetical protein